jgi:hypothetical protein
MSEAVFRPGALCNDWAWGLTTRNSAVAPASLRTWIRKVRQPCSTSSASAGPCAAFTRISGLISTLTRQSGSKISWMLRVAAASSDIAMAASSACCFAGDNGAPR